MAKRFEKRFTYQDMDGSKREFTFNIPNSRAGMKYIELVAKAESTGEKAEMHEFGCRHLVLLGDYEQEINNVDELEGIFKNPCASAYFGEAFAYLMVPFIQSCSTQLIELSKEINKENS